MTLLQAKQERFSSGMMKCNVIIFPVIFQKHKKSSDSSHIFAKLNYSPITSKAIKFIRENKSEIKLKE